MTIALARKSFTVSQMIKDIGFTNVDDYVMFSAHLGDCVSWHEDAIITPAWLKKNIAMIAKEAKYRVVFI